MTEGPQSEEWPDDVTAITHHVDHLELIIEEAPAGSAPPVRREDLVDIAERLSELASLLPPGRRPARPRTAESTTDQIWHHIRAIEQLQRRAHPPARRNTDRWTPGGCRSDRGI